MHATVRVFPETGGGGRDGGRAMERESGEVREKARGSEIDTRESGEEKKRERKEKREKRVEERERTSASARLVTRNTRHGNSGTIL